MNGRIQELGCTLKKGSQKGDRVYANTAGLTVREDEALQF